MKKPKTLSLCQFLDEPIVDSVTDLLPEVYLNPCCSDTGPSKPQWAPHQPQHHNGMSRSRLDGVRVSAKMTRRWRCLQNMSREGRVQPQKPNT